MVLTLERALSVVKHAAYNDTSVPSKDIVDEAAVRLLQMHQWRCTIKPPRHVGVRAAISFTGATWTSATRTLTKASAFTTYTHAPGDPMTIDAGATASFRAYEVQEKVSANAVILAEDIGATDGSTDIGGTLNANRAVILPSDFGWGLKSLVAANSSVTLNTFEWSSMEKLAELRSGFPLTPIGLYHGALWQAHNISTAGGAPAWRLELWPYPTEADPDLFLVSYRVKWSRPSVDAGTLPIPEILEPLFIQILRAVTRGYEEEEEATVEDRIDRLKGSSLFMDTVNADGLMQPTMGPLPYGNEGAMSSWEIEPTAYAEDPS